MPLVPLVFLALHCGASSADSAAGPAGSGGSSTGGAGGTGGVITDGGFEDGCADSTYLCQGSVAWRCDVGELVDPVDCANDGRSCFEGIGCAVCEPAATSCSNGIGTYCTEDGEREEQFVCDPQQGLDCQPQGCLGPCAPQKLGRSHVGCDFYPTVTANSAWGEWFPFGAQVTNTTEEDASVIVTRGDDIVAERVLPAGATDVIELPWVDELKGPDADVTGTVTPPAHSVLSRISEGGGAYRLRSSQPVVVTQLNTVRSNNPDGVTKGCPPSAGGQCLSYSNDASLLLPSHVLGLTHVLMGWRAWQLSNATEPGMGDFVAITAVDDATNVQITPVSPTLPIEGSEPLQPQEPASFVLQRGDVLQLFTDASVAGARWAGAGVTADRPVQVLTGAPCVNIPEGAPTCDHIEESNLPRSMLGKRYMVTAPRVPSGRLRHIVRFHGVEDETLVQFDPPDAHKAITLGPGEVVDLDLPAASENAEQLNFFVSSTKVFGVTQYMVGNQAEPYDPYAPGADMGDPSQSFVVPTSRYLKRYIIGLAPGFEMQELDIVAATGAEVLLNDEPLPPESFQAIGASGLSVARVGDLDPSKRHVLRGDKAFGVQVRGFGPFTSYMVPGGIDLRSPAQ